jgi:hypothetical protein
MSGGWDLGAKFPSHCAPRMLVWMGLRIFRLDTSVPAGLQSGPVVEKRQCDQKYSWKATNMF